MDPHHIQTSGFFEPSDEERERPALVRFWRVLPPKGKIGIFFGAWHTMPIIQRVMGEIDDGEFARQIGEIQRLEQMLCDEGVLLLKYRFHLSREQQNRRLRALRDDPKTSWRVTDRDWEYFKIYKQFVGVCEPFLRKTSTGEAPWIVVPAADPRYRGSDGRSASACGVAQPAGRKACREPARKDPATRRASRPVQRHTRVEARSADDRGAISQGAGEMAGPSRRGIARSSFSITVHGCRL
jgi:hypothetical protein